MGEGNNFEPLVCEKKLRHVLQEMLHRGMSKNEAVKRLVDVVPVDLDCINLAFKSIEVQPKVIAAEYGAFILPDSDLYGYSDAPVSSTGCLSMNRFTVCASPNRERTNGIVYFPPISFR